MGFWGKVGDTINDIGEAFSDMGERALTGVGLKDKEPASLSLDGGELKHNVDLSDFSPEDKAQIEAVLAQQAQSLDEMKSQLDQAKSDEDPVAQKVLEADIAKLEAGLTEFKFEIETKNFNFGKFVAGNLAMPVVGGLVAQGIGQDTDKRLEAAMGTLVAGPEATSGGASGASGAGSTVGAAGGGTTTDDFNRMLDLMSRDPAALMDELSALDPESKNTMLTMLQGRLQEMNRMFSMMSNMQKSLHDTQKAMINNMRV